MRGEADTALRADLPGFLPEITGSSPGNGCTANVEIRNGSRSTISYLLSPLARYQHDSLRER
ncbi:MAG: hypothetical protein HC829_02855 [Bacteroidales bacterium]|nr:hypothetical protein [Bacteroidales bacterium]